MSTPAGSSLWTIFLLTPLSYTQMIPTTHCRQVGWPTFRAVGTTSLCQTNTTPATCSHSTGIIQVDVQLFSGQFLFSGGMGKGEHRINDGYREKAGGSYSSSWNACTVYISHQALGIPRLTKISADEAIANSPWDNLVWTCRHPPFTLCPLEAEHSCCNRC